MIVMDMKINNFLALNNFHLNMSYPKRIVGSYVKDEYLKDRPNFRYKKVNILMGANATGKTSIGKMLMQIFNFMDKKQYDALAKVITDKKRSFFYDRFCGGSICIISGAYGNKAANRKRISIFRYLCSSAVCQNQ